MADKSKLIDALINYAETPSRQVSSLIKTTPQKLGNALYENYKESVPLHNRMYLQTLFGDRTQPFTSADLTDKELDIIGDTIKASRKSRADEVAYQENWANQEHRKLHPLLQRDKQALQQGIGNVQYDDYIRAGMASGPNGQEDDAKYYPTWNALGRFNYSTTPNGNFVAKDTYDFYNPGRAASVEAYEKMNPVSKAASMLPFAWESIKSLNARPLASAIGEAYIGRDGRPVNIVVPKK